MIEHLPFEPPAPLHTPVLFLVYKRPDTTKHVFEAIRQAKPSRLYVAADGPRLDIFGEMEKVKQVRDIVLKGVDWQCEVKTLFRDTNLGCKYAVSTGIDWFFENEKEGIILEDDILPSQSFFWFCQELLIRYRYDTRVFIISGYNKQNQWMKDSLDYFFSNFGGIWGWASWRRAWAHYDGKMSKLKEFTRNNYFQSLLGKKLGNIRQNQMIYAIKNNLDTWDYQWGFSRHINSGLACVPSRNLISNIGYGLHATHTRSSSTMADLTFELKFPLKINPFVVADRNYDDLFFKKKRSFKTSFLRNLLKLA